MKLVRFGQPGSERAGVIDDAGTIRDLSAVLPDISGATIGSAEWAGLAALQTLADLPAADADMPLGPCLTGVGKLVCLGLNDKVHAQQLGLGDDIKPLLFLKPQSAITGGLGPVTYPKVGKKMDWETELLVVIGQQCRYVGKEEALSVVAGYAIHNDLSDRFWQTDPKGGLTALTSGKSFDTFAPIGPWLVTPDEVGNPNDLAVKLWVNGELRQDFNSRDYIFDVQSTIEFVSQFFTLYPGDAISMGSGPGNAGSYQDRYLKPGDHVEGEIERLGRQSFTIAKEA